MYLSLSKLLHEQQATAAKKLGVLENALEENFQDPDDLSDFPPHDPNQQTDGVHGADSAAPSDEWLTLREHKIW